MEPVIWTSGEAREIWLVTDDSVNASRDAGGAVNKNCRAFDAMGSVHEWPGAAK